MAGVKRVVPQGERVEARAHPVLTMCKTTEQDHEPTIVCARFPISSGVSGSSGRSGDRPLGPQSSLPRPARAL